MGTIRALVIIIVTTFSFLHGGVNSLPPFIEEETPPLFENQQVITSAYRLPNSVVPTHYNVELQPILDNGYGTRFTAPGKVFIDVTCKTSTNSITLHALTLNILQASIKVSLHEGCLHRLNNSCVKSPAFFVIPFSLLPPPIVYLFV